MTIWWSLQSSGIRCYVLRWTKWWRLVDRIWWTNTIYSIWRPHLRPSELQEANLFTSPSILLSLIRGPWNLACWCYMLALRMYFDCSFPPPVTNHVHSEGLSQKRLIHYLAIYVACGFVATELSLFLICRPISNYWAVPTPNRRLPCNYPSRQL